MLASRSNDLLFAMQLGLAIYTRWRSLLLFLAWHVIWLLAKHIIGRDLNEQTASLTHRNGKVAWSIGIELLCQCREFLIGLTSIDIGPCRTVDDYINVILLHHSPDGIQISDIKIGSFKSLNLIDIGEDIFVRTGLCHDAHLVTKLTIGASDKYIHIKDNYLNSG